MKNKYKKLIIIARVAPAIILYNIFLKVRRFLSSLRINRYLRSFFSSRLLRPLRSLRVPFLPSLSSSQKNVAVFVFLFIFLVGGGALYFFLPEGGLSSGSNKNGKVDIFSKGKLMGTYGLGDTAILGNLEITLHNTKEGSYKTFGQGASNSRISKTFFGANVKIFNTAPGPGLENTEILFMGLKDDLGREYDRDRSIEFALGNIKDYGPDKNVWPRTIREGYLLFPGPPKESESLNLIIYSDVLKQKIIFDLVR